MTHFYQHLPSLPSLTVFYLPTYSVAFSNSQSIWLPSVVCSALSTLCILTLFSLSTANFPLYPSHIYSKSLTSVSYCNSFWECTAQNIVPPHQADCFLSGGTTVGAPSPSHLNICPSHYRSHRRTWAPFPHADSNAGENSTSRDVRRHDLAGQIDPNIPGCFESMGMVRSMDRDQSEDGNACTAPGIHRLGRLDGMWIRKPIMGLTVRSVGMTVVF